MSRENNTRSIGYDSITRKRDFIFCRKLRDKILAFG